MSNLDALIDETYALKDEIAVLNQAVKSLSDKKKHIDSDIEAIMAELNLKVAGNGQHTVSLKDDVFAQADDWDVLYNYIKENDAFYLLNKRISVTAFREIINAGETVPGLTPVVRVKLVV